MKTSTALILFLSIYLTAAQLNFEGNPLTEHTEYLAEESHFSERTSRQKDPEKNNDLQERNQVTSREMDQSGIPQKLYPVYNQNPTQEVNSKIKKVQNSESIQNSEPVQSSNPIQNAEPVQSRQLQDNFLNTNALQQDQSQTINPANLALQIFMNSKTPKESEAALSYYLQGGEGLAEQLELQKQRQIREKELQQEQQRIQHEQMIQKQQQQLKQEQYFQQVQQEHLQKQRAQQLEQQHLNQDQFYRQQVQHLQPQIQQNQLQTFQQAQPQTQEQIQPNQFHNQFQNQQILPQPMADPVPQQASSVPRIPFVQPRNDFIPGPPIYRRPMRRTSYRQPVPLQPRIGPGMYVGPQPPTYPGKMIKPPVEVIYSRPPTYARGAPVMSSPPVHYEGMGPWFSESDHRPPSKDIYYSQLYAQSYDPHYYNYIAKTGKIKPHLYGKLNGEEKEDDGILAELFRGFTKHGIKNIMNPTFLLGMTIPALTFMLTALVQKRSLARSSSLSLKEEHQKRVVEYLEKLQKAMTCVQNLKNPPYDQCWQ